jgi:hypothetical protein
MFVCSDCRLTTAPCRRLIAVPKRARTCARVWIAVSMVLSAPCASEAVETEMPERPSAETLAPPKLTEITVVGAVVDADLKGHRGHGAEEVLCR